MENLFFLQHMFYDDPRVLYISIHRFDEGTFFPGKHDADHPFVGSGAGKGKFFKIYLFLGYARAS